MNYHDVKTPPAKIMLKADDVRSDMMVQFICDIIMSNESEMNNLTNDRIQIFSCLSSALPFNSFCNSTNSNFHPLGFYHV